jgi:hypothetical protein
MRSALFLVALALCATRTDGVGAAPRAGKVIRVARKAAGYAGHPRFCSVRPGDLAGFCIGSKAPEVGERLTAVDQNRVLGTLRVTQVQPYNDGCQQTNQWTINTVVDTGDVSIARGTMLGVSDVPLDASRAHTVVVDKSPTGHTWGMDTIYAIDANNDGSVDVEFIQFPCDDSGNAAMNGSTSQCHEVWANATGKGLERLRHDRFQVCN